MTQVTMSRDGDRRTITAIGHAEGRPDVCAGISTLMYSLYVWLINTENAHDAYANLNPGDAEIDYVIEEQSADSVWDYLICGFLQLQEEAPEAVNVKIIPSLGEISDSPK